MEDVSKLIRWILFNALYYILHLQFFNIYKQKYTTRHYLLPKYQKYQRKKKIKVKGRY